MKMHFLLLALAIETVAPQAAFVEPFAVAKDRAGNLYICEHKGQKITKVDPSGAPSIFAGTGSAGYGGDNGPAAAASFRDPHGIVIAPDNRMYVADTQNHTIRRIDLRTGVIATIAGTGERGYSGDGGPAAKAQFNGTFGIALDGGGRRLYVADLGNRRIRMIDLKSGIVTTVAGDGTRGVPPDGAKAIDSPLVDPRAVAVGPKGDVYILERNGNALRVVDTQGRIRTLIAPGSVQPDMKGPKHLCVDRDGSVIIADAENHLIRRYAKGVLTTLDAGQLKRPHGVYVDRSGTLYIADSDNHRVVRLSLSPK
jgi:DNA-binding beta-propeller fold protein YncE